MCCGRCEEALKSRGVAVVIAELPEAAPPPISPPRGGWRSRRATAAGSACCCGSGPLPIATAATTRWQIAAAPSTPDRFGGLGRTAFDLSLNRNRRGRCGRFICVGITCVRLPPARYLSVWLRRLPTDRLIRAPLARAG